MLQKNLVLNQKTRNHTLHVFASTGPFPELTADEASPHENLFRIVVAILFTKLDALPVP